MSGWQLRPSSSVVLATAAATVAALAIRRRVRTRRDAGQHACKAPVVFKGSVEVDCAAGKAFDLLVNTDRYATGPGSPVRRMDRIPDEDTRVGTRWREVIRLGPIGHMTVWSEIVALDAPTHLRLRFQMPGAAGTLTYRIGPGVERETCIIQEQTFVVTGRLAGIRRWMIDRLWRPRAAERLQSIRSILESHHVGDVSHPKQGGV